MMYTDDTYRELWSRLVSDHINCAMNHPNIFFWSDQGKPYIPHLVGSSQHLESNLGPTEYKAGVLSNQLWCLGTWWWETHEFSNVWIHLDKVIKKKKHKAKQIYDIYTWNKFSLVTSCIVVYNVADEKTNITLVSSQPVPSPSSPLWLYSTATALNYNNKHCTCTNHKFFFRSNSHVIYYTHIQSVRKFRYCELPV